MNIPSRKATAWKEGNCNVTFQEGAAAVAGNKHVLSREELDGADIAETCGS